MHDIARATLELSDQLMIYAQRMSAGNEWREPSLDEAAFARATDEIGGLSQAYLRRLIRYIDAQMPKADTEYKTQLLMAMIRYYAATASK